MGVGEARDAKIWRHASRFHADEVEEQRLAVLPSPFEYAPPAVVSTRDLDVRKRPGVRVCGKEGARSEVDEMIKAQWWTPGVGSYGSIDFVGSSVGASLDRYPRSKPTDADTIGPGPYLDVSESYSRTLKGLSGIKLKEASGVSRPRSKKVVHTRLAIGRSPGPAYDTSSAYLKTARSVPGLVLRPQHLVATKLDEKRVRAAPDPEATAAYFERLEATKAKDKAAPAPAALQPRTAPETKHVDHTQKVYVAASKGGGDVAGTFAYLSSGAVALKDYASRNVRQTVEKKEKAKPTAFVPPPLPNAPTATVSRNTPTAGKASAAEYKRRYLAAFRACRDAELAYGMEAIPKRADSGEAYEAGGVGFAARVPSDPTRDSEKQRADRLLQKLVVSPELGKQDPRLAPDEQRFWSAHVYDVYKPPRSDTMYDTPRKAATPKQARRPGDEPADASEPVEFDGTLTDSKWRKLLKNSAFIGNATNAHVNEHGVVLPPKRRNAKELFRESAYKISRGGRG